MLTNSAIDNMCEREMVAFLRKAGFKLTTTRHWIPPGAVRKITPVESHAIVMLFEKHNYETLADQDMNYTIDHDIVIDDTVRNIRPRDGWGT